MISWKMSKISRFGYIIIFEYALNCRCVIMNEKEKHIIREGMKLFATKGYHKTSVQDIATNANISKGAFYLHFRSKEAFIARAMQFFHDEIVHELGMIETEDDPPKLCLAKQITWISQYIYKYREFIIMHLREDISIGEHTEELFRHMKLENLKWLQKSVLSIYGKQVNSFVLDVVIQLDGLMKSYYQWIVLDDVQINVETFGHFIVERMDDLVTGMVHKDAKPIIHSNSIPKAYQDVLNRESRLKRIEAYLTVLGEQITELEQDEDTKQRLVNVVQIIGEKLKEENVESITIQGLLAHFNHIPELQEACDNIAKLLQIERLK